jgi:ankyrin repeat protein
MSTVAGDMHAIIDERAELLRRADQLARDAKLREEVDERGARPIHSAIQNGDIQAVRILLQAGAEASARDAFGYTPLQYVSKVGPDEIVDILLKYVKRDDIGTVCAPLNRNKDTGMTCLHLAATRGSLRTAKSLLSAGADVNGGQEAGQTPLSAALREGQLAVARFLYQNGANPSAIERFAFCDVKEAKAILDNNPSIVIDIPDSYHGPNALQVSALGGNLAVVRFLVEERGGKVDRCGRTGGAISFAADGGDLATIKYLADHGADVNEVALWGKQSPLARAIAKGHKDAALFLVSRRARLDTVDACNESPIDKARRCLGEEFVKALLSAQENATGGAEDQRPAPPSDQPSPPPPVRDGG